MKRIVCIADPHCGHNFGLTPPQWWVKKERCEEGNYPSQIPEVQRRLWGEYVTTLNRIKPIDGLLLNGDAIDGKGERSGGTELLTSDREEQGNMAVQCIKQAEAEDIIMTYGTPYHTGSNEDWENKIAKEVKATSIGSHEWPQWCGVTFDMKHYIGNSSVPYGKGGPISKERLWNLLWAERQEQPKADIIIRSHVHWAWECGEPGVWKGIVTHALQAAGTKYGARLRSNVVTLGLCYFDIFDNGEWCITWQHFGKATRKASVLRLT